MLYHKVTDPADDYIWTQVLSHEGEIFQTSKGLPFTYTQKISRNGEPLGEIVIDRREKTITRATIYLAYRNVLELDGNVTGPKKLGVFGASYLYPVFIKIGVIKISKKGTTSMTHTELTEIREVLNLTKGELAKKLDVSPMILGRYEKGSLAIPEAVAEKVKRMVEPKDTPSAPAKRTRKAKKGTGEKPVEEKVATVAEPKKSSKSRKKKTPTLVIQSLLGGTITPEEIISRVPDDVDTVYIKPEENKAYWVRGDETGSITLW